MRQRCFREWVQLRTVEQKVDLPVPQVVGKTRKAVHVILQEHGSEFNAELHALRTPCFVCVKKKEARSTRVHVVFACGHTLKYPAMCTTWVRASRRQTTPVFSTQTTPPSSLLKRFSGGQNMERVGNPVGTCRLQYGQPRVHDRLFRWCCDSLLKATHVTISETNHDSRRNWALNGLLKATSHGCKKLVARARMRQTVRRWTSTAIFARASRSTNHQAPCGTSVFSCHFTKPLRVVQCVSETLRHILQCGLGQHLLRLPTQAELGCHAVQSCPRSGERPGEMAHHHAAGSN